MIDKDIATLRYTANFCTVLGKNINWIPVNELGTTRYTNADIKKILDLEPEKKKLYINTLYEAIQLFVNSDFEETLDIVNIQENGIIWEHHKPGYYAVKTNNGCCASTASWLIYMLSDKYEEVGLLSFSRPNGSGHVFNYIFHKGNYYIIDLMPYTKKYKEFCCIETGKKSDFVKAKYITAACIRTNSLYDYASFYNRMLKYGGVSFVFYKQSTDYALPMYVQEFEEYVKICYPKEQGVVQLSSNTKRIKTEFIEGPREKVNWNEEGLI